MKTFLELCKGVCREGNIADGETAISTVVAQVGELNRVVNYVKQAWVEIQNRHQHTGLNWRWLHSEFELTTVASTDAYAYGDAAVEDSIAAAAITRFRNWNVKDYDDPPKIYLQSSGIGSQTYLTFLDWVSFKHLYKLGTQNTTEGYPAHITINPRNQIVLGPIPNGIYIVTGDYQKSAQILSGDADEPELPEDFEDVIMWRALAKHALRTNAPETLTMAEEWYATYMGQLEQDQLAEIPIGAPLA